MAFKSLQEIKNNIKTTSNNSEAFNANNLSTGQANQLGFKTQGTKNGDDQKKQQSLLQQQLNKDFNRQQEKIKDLQEQKQAKKLDESNSRDMNIVEDAITGLNKVGETIGDLSGFSENWADFKQNISEGNIGKAAAELPKTALSFAASVPLGMASIPFTAPAGIAETLTGNRYTEAEDGRVSNEKLNAEERVAQGLSTAIDLAGIPFGGTGRLVGGAVTLGRTAMRDTAGQAVRQAAGRAVRNEALESAGEAAARTATQAAANQAATNNALRGAMRVFDNNLENATFGAQLGFDMAEEGGEEFVQGLAGAVRGNESEDTGGLKELKKGSTWTSALENAALGAAGGALFSGVGRGMRAMSDIINEEDNTRERRSVGANVREQREAAGTVDDDFTAATPLTPREYNITTDDNERLTSVARDIASDQMDKTARDERNFSTSGTVASDQSLAVDEVKFNGASVLKLFSEEAEDGSDKREAQNRFLEALDLGEGVNELHPRARNYGATLNYQDLINALQTSSVDNNIASSVIQTLNAQIQAINEDRNHDDIYCVVGKQPGLNQQGVAVRLTALIDPMVDTDYKMLVNPMLANNLTADYDGDIMSVLFDRREIDTAIRNNYFLSYNATSSNPAGNPEWNLDYAQSGNLGYNPDNTCMYTSNQNWLTAVTNAFEELFTANNIPLANSRAGALAQIFAQTTNGNLNENLANNQMFRTDPHMQNMIRAIASQEGYNQRMGQFFASLNEYLYNQQGGINNQNRNRANAMLHDRTIAHVIQQIALATEDIQEIQSTISKADKMLKENFEQTKKEIASPKTLKRGVRNDTSLAAAQTEGKNVTQENVELRDKMSAIYYRRKTSNIMQGSSDNEFYETAGITFGELDDSVIGEIISFALEKTRVGEDVEDLLISAIRFEVKAKMERKFGKSFVTSMEGMNEFVDSFIDIYNEVVDKFNNAKKETNSLSFFAEMSKIKISKGDSIQSKLKNNTLLDKLYDTYKETTIREFFSIGQSGYLGNNTFEQVVGALEHFDHGIYTDAWLYDFTAIDDELAEFIPDFLRDIYKRKVRREEQAYENFGEFLASSTEDFKFAERTRHAREAYERYQNSLNDNSISENERQKRETEYLIALDDFTVLFDRILSVLDKSVVKYFNLFLAQDILVNPDELTGALLSGDKDSIYSALISAYITYNLRTANDLVEIYMTTLADGDVAYATLALDMLRNELRMVSKISPFYKNLCSRLEAMLLNCNNNIANNEKTVDRAVTDLRREWMLAYGLCSTTVRLNEKKVLIQNILADEEDIDYFYSNILKTKESSLTESSFSTKLRSAKRHIDLKVDKIENHKKVWESAIGMFDTPRQFIEALRTNALENEIKNESHAVAFDAYSSSMFFDKAQKDKGTVPESTSLAYAEINAQSRTYSTKFEEKMSTEVDPYSKTEDTFKKDEIALLNMIFEPEAGNTTVAYADGVEVRDFTSFWRMVTGREITSLNDLTKDDLMKLVEKFPFLPQIFFPKSLGFQLTGENECTVSLYTSPNDFIDKLNEINGRTVDKDNNAEKKKIRNAVKRTLTSSQSFRKIVIGSTWSKLLGKQKIENMRKIPYEKFEAEFEKTENKLIDLLLEHLAYYTANNHIGRDDYGTDIILANDDLQEEFLSLASPLLSLRKMIIDPQGTSLINSGQRALIENMFSDAEEQTIRNVSYAAIASSIVSGLGISAREAIAVGRDITDSIENITAEERQNALNQLLNSPSIQLLQVYSSLGNAFNSVNGSNLLSVIPQVATGSDFERGFENYINALPNVSDAVKQAIINEYRNTQINENFWNDFAQGLNNENYFDAQSDFENVVNEIFNYPNRTTIRNAMQAADDAARRGNVLFGALCRADTRRSLESFLQEYQNRFAEIRAQYSGKTQEGQARRAAAEAQARRHLAYRLFGVYVSTMNLGVEPGFLLYFESTTRDLTTVFQRIAWTIAADDRLNLPVFLEGKDNDISPEQRRQKFSEELSINFLSPDVYSAVQNYVDNSANIDVVSTVSSNGMSFYENAPLVPLVFDGRQANDQQFSADHSCSNNQLHTATGQDLINARGYSNRYIDARTGQLLTATMLHQRAAEQITYYDKEECSCQLCCATHRSNGVSLLQKIIAFANENLALQAKRSFMPIEDSFKNLQSRYSIERQEITFTNQGNIQTKIPAIRNLIADTTNRMAQSLRDSIENDRLYQSLGFQEHEYLQWARMCYGYVLATVEDVNGQQHRIVLTENDIENLTNPALWQRYEINVNTNNPQILQVQNLMIPPSVLSKRVNRAFEEHCRQNNIVNYRDIDEDTVIEIAYRAVTEFQDYTVNDNARLQRTLLNRPYIPEKRYDVDYETSFSPGAAAKFYQTRNSKYTNTDNREELYEELTAKTEQERTFETLSSDIEYQDFIKLFNRKVLEILSSGLAAEDDVTFSAIIYGKGVAEDVKDGMRITFSPSMTSAASKMKKEEDTNLKYAKTIYNNASEFKKVLQRSNVIVLGKDKETQLDVFRKLYKKNNNRNDERMYVETDSWLTKTLMEMGIYQDITGRQTSMTLDNGKEVTLVEVMPNELNNLEVMKKIKASTIGLYTYDRSCHKDKLMPQTGKLVIGFEQQEFAGTFGDSIVMATKPMRERLSVYSDDSQTLGVSEFKNLWGNVPDMEAEIQLINGYDIANGTLNFTVDDVIDNVRNFGAALTRKYMGENCELSEDAIAYAAENYLIATRNQQGFISQRNGCYGIVQAIFNGYTYFIPLLFPENTSRTIEVTESKPTYDDRAGTIAIQADGKVSMEDMTREAYKVVLSTLGFKGMNISTMKGFVNQARGEELDECVPGIMDSLSGQRGVDYDSSIMPFVFIEQKALDGRLCRASEETDLIALDTYIRQDRCYNPFNTPMWEAILNALPPQTREQYERELQDIDYALNESSTGDWMRGSRNFESTQLFQDIINERLNLSQSGNLQRDEAYNRAIRKVFVACQEHGVNPFYLLCTATREDVEKGYDRHSNFYFQAGDLSLLSKTVNSTETFRDFFSFATATSRKPTGLVQPTFRNNIRPQNYQTWENQKKRKGNDNWYLVYDDFKVFVPFYDPATKKPIKFYLGRLYGTLAQPSHDQYRVADSCNASKGPIRTICLGMSNGMNGCDNRLLMDTIQKTYQAPPNVDRDALEASARQAAREHPERYAIDNIAELAPELAYISDYTRLRVQALKKVTKNLYSHFDIYSATEENKLIGTKEWWANEVADWNDRLRNCFNEGESLNLFEIRYIMRMALGKCNDIKGNDKGTINERQYREAKQIITDAIRQDRNANFLTAFRTEGTYYGNNNEKPRYTMAYIDREAARIFCRKFNTQANQNLEGAVDQFIAQGYEHAQATIANLDAINVNDSRHSVAILMNDLFDAMQLANHINPDMLFIAGFRIKDFCRMDYNIIRKYTEGFTQEQFEEMRQYAQNVREGMIAMQQDAKNMDRFQSGQSQQFARSNTRNVKMMEAKNTVAKLLKNAVRLEQAMALANPLVTAASFLDKGVSSNVMLYALRASEAEGLRGRLSPYTRNGIHLDDNFIEVLIRDPRFTDMLDAIRVAKMNNAFNELMSAIQRDPTLSPREWVNSKFGVNASVFDRGFNLIAEFGSAGHTWKRARNEIFIRRLCDYLGEEGLSMFGQELHGMEGMNMLAYILQGRETGNPSLGLLELFSSDFAIQTERAYNASLKPDWVQDNVVTIMFSHISRNRAWLPFLQATFGCTFFRASMNLGGRMLQHVLPMSSLHYLITRHIINTTNDEALATELQTVQFAANLREALLLDMQHITAPLIVGMLLSYSGGIQPPDDEDKWGNFSEWTIFGLRIQNNWWLEDILGVWLPIACMWKASELGHPNSSLLYDGITQALGNNPALKLSGVMECLLDPDAALDDVEGEIQKYSDYPGGSPTGLEYLLGNLGACSLNVLGKFITPGLIKEIGTNLRDYEVSYNKIYTENVTGGLTTEAEDDGQTTYTTFNDAMIRKVTRNNPVLALIMNIIPNGATTGYSADEMPKTKYIDSAQYTTMHRLSVNNEDGTPKSEEEQANLCTQIISILNDTEDLDGLYKQGFLLDSETKYAVSQMLYELRAQAQEQYNQYTISTNGLDYYVLGDGDFQRGKVEATKYKDAFYDYKNQIQKVYDKLWSDELNQGIKYYNRYNTTYAQDAEGNYYATGFRKGLGGMLSPIKTADGTLYDKGETTGYENDWGTPSELNGETMYDEAGNALRGLIGYEDRSYNDDKPSLDDFGNNNSSSSGSSSYGSSSGSSSSTPYTKKKSSGGSGGSSYQPTQQTRSSSLPSIYSRTGFSRNRTYGPDIDRLNPQYETKGSREAYRRQDF